jgi:hypothetical protein
MKKFKLLLLDANVVIKAFELGIWQELIERCDIWLASTVIQEAEYFITGDGKKCPIELDQYAADKRITEFGITPSELLSFKGLFDSSYLEKLDDGETESLAFLINAHERLMICSADKIVYRILGNLRRKEQGISLEEILQQIGLTCALPRQFGKAYRIEWTQKGFEEGLGGIGVKPKDD